MPSGKKKIKSVNCYSGKIKTNSNSPVELVEIPLPDSSVNYIRSRILAANIGTNAANVYDIRNVFKRVDNTITQIGVDDKLEFIEIAGLVVSFTNDGKRVKIMVTGLAGQRIKWKAKVDVDRVCWC